MGDVLYPKFVRTLSQKARLIEQNPSLRLHPDFKNIHKMTVLPFALLAIGIFVLTKHFVDKK